MHERRHLRRQRDADPLLDAYRNGLTFLTGRVDARAVLPDALATIARGRLAPELVTTRSAAWDDAPDALLDTGPKVVIERWRPSQDTG